jgi:hypothetical protein
MERLLLLTNSRKHCKQPGDIFLCTSRASLEASSPIYKEVFGKTAKMSPCVRSVVVWFIFWR